MTNEHEQAGMKQPEEGEPAAQPTVEETPAAAQPEPVPEPPARRRLMRSRSERMLAGIAGGIGVYLDIDPVLVRIAFVLLAIFGSGLGLLIYIIAAIIMPLEPLPEGGVPQRGGLGGRPPERRATHTSALVLGLLLVAIGAIWLLSVLDVPTPPWNLVLALGLMVIGAALLWGAREGRHGGLIALGAVLAFVLAIGTTIEASFDFDGAFGERVERPAATAELERDYSHAFGSLTVDLRDLVLDEGTTRVDVEIAFGEAVVWVPEDVPVRVDSTTNFGSTEVFGREHSGVGVDRRHVDDGYDGASRRLWLDISTTFGSGEVRR